MAGMNDDFEGQIGLYGRDSVPAWPAPKRPGADAPNVVFVVLDDVGFAQLNCYGSTIDTPNMDRLARSGLRYTNFHTTTLCSPSRACLLTGRNHHTVGMRSVSNRARPFPSGRGGITPRAATLAQVLRDYGYSTWAVGKWHLAPMMEASAAGPFDNWPLQKGFERYYGFIDALTDQFAPELTYDNHSIPTPDRPDYHVSEDIVDHAIEFVRDQQAIYPEKPFFLYAAFGACHSPHQAPPSYLQKYRGRFDEGWEVAREQWFERQKKLGIIPEDTVLPPSNPGVPAWDSLTAEQKLVASRLQEAAAAMLDHTDAQIGRLIEYLESVEKLDNTLFVLLSDNGASPEGGPMGTANEMQHLNQLEVSDQFNIEHLEEIGGPRSYCNYPWGWSQAGNSPCRWYKQYLFAGGVRDPLIIHWPARIGDAGALRRQFHHVTDVMPTVLEAVGASAPQMFQGIPQLPVAGISMAYTFNQADAPSQKTVQYFEMSGHRAIWHNGWKAVTFHDPSVGFDAEQWELFNLETDFSESNDLAAEEPERLRDMINRWWVEAGKHGVLPLLDRASGFAQYEVPTGSPQDRKRFVYYQGMAHVPTVAAVDLRNRSHRITATIDRSTQDDAGVLIAHGGDAAGYALFVQSNRLTYEYNCAGERSRVVSDRELPAGRVDVELVFTKVSDKKGEAVMRFDGDAAGKVDVPRLVAGFGTIEGLDVGRDLGTPVSELYEPPFEFTGRLESIVVEVADDQVLDAAATTRAELAAQ